jgi:Peptidase family M1 domain
VRAAGLRRIGAGAVLVLAAACTGSGNFVAVPGLPSSSPSTGPSGRPATCPATQAAPDPKRPQIQLRFDVAADLRTVTGTEHVTFTPDKPVTSLVFRMWANGRAAPQGTALKITSARSGTAAGFNVSHVGDSDRNDGSLLELPLGRTSPAGTAVSADVAFTLALPDPRFERWGSTGETAFWATGHPILAWERGVGWQREPAVPFASEATMSEAARYDTTVVAPAAKTVLLNGTPAEPKDAGGGRREWSASAPTARDVSVAVGTFTTATGKAGDTDIVAALASDALEGSTATPPDVHQLLDFASRSVSAEEKLYGPFPFPHYVVVDLPGLSSGGIEYPGMIMVGPDYMRDEDDVLVVAHETGHQYFYAMVGDDQERDPWLDEAFATYTESLVTGNAPEYEHALQGSRLRVGEPMSYWSQRGENPYFDTVYMKGAAALLTARDRAGTARFDQALRCYVNANAWRVATPTDLERALAGLPEATRVLKDAGAF